MNWWLLTLISSVLAHATTGEKPTEMLWEDWHMLEEHQIEEYDPITFFKLHDLNDNGHWESPDILNIYGLARETIVGDGSGMGLHEHGHEVVTPEARKHVVDTILQLIDSDRNGQITAQEWVDFITSGNHLPDFGYGQGHHLDFESEYEEHHWNKYHRDQDPDVLIKHKEDIEHELLHHEHGIEETHNLSPEIREITKNYRSKIRLENLPSKYTV